MRDIPRSVMLFAAGFGTRMKPLTDDRPKPLIRVAGTPLIDHALALTKAVAPRKVVANLHYKPEMLEQHLAPLGVQTVLESPDILDTGGGLRNALPTLGGGPVYTLNPDAIWKGANPLALLQNAWQPDRMDALLACVPVARTCAYEGNGDFEIDGQGRLARGTGVVYGGAQIIKTGRLRDIAPHRFSLNVLWDMMLDDKRVFGLIYPGQWCDVGHPGGIAIAEAMLENADV
ncbi:nucleotidyltransferase family protein [Roseobacter sp. YSTF-M11]|uniref:Nucleotidyltransferase family protein n=1 Tax=Roseobacter insulae TaxID=2859783 RepID=A0A9X1FS77_9RHOB|nr:nucleotidyltransferase family protein [Roseobacter insulae]MBW4706698.1 nucleotidyltransferase family protein [Roseobacter insulae]